MVKLKHLRTRKLAPRKISSFGRIMQFSFYWFVPLISRLRIFTAFWRFWVSWRRRNFAAYCYVRCVAVAKRDVLIIFTVDWICGRRHDKLIRYATVLFSSSRLDKIFPLKFSILWAWRYHPGLRHCQRQDKNRKNTREIHSNRDLWTTSAVI